MARRENWSSLYRRMATVATAAILRATAQFGERVAFKFTPESVEYARTRM